MSKHVQPRPSKAAPDDRIASLVNEFFDRRQAGEDLSPEQFAAEHPDLSGELQPYLDGLTMLDRLRSATRADQPPIIEETVRGLPVIPGYRLCEEIGRGGMGVVYRALQIATKRMVAVKVMLAGPVASASAQRRFEREVELAARINHPSVVAVLESGQTPAGQKYFAMNLFDGVPLDKYVQADAEHYRPTLLLFRELCLAVSYAHGLGVIHRDLKPANVLIDERGQPHILDFGLAKATDQTELDENLSAQPSAPGQIMGTLRYLPPEQAAGKHDEIDVRTDVYALGIMLYESLTGCPPIDPSGKPSEFIQRVLEQPPKPLTQRAGWIHNDVETIVLKALEKEKDRRYQSAAEMAEDIRRFLDGEPILAKRSSRFYVLAKKLRKHRSRLLVATALVTLAFGGLWGGMAYNQYSVRLAEEREILRGRREVLRIQRILENGYDPDLISDAYQALGQYPTVTEAKLVVGRLRFEAERARFDANTDTYEEGPELFDDAIKFLDEEILRQPAEWPIRALLVAIYEYRGFEGDAEIADRIEAAFPHHPWITSEDWYLRSFTMLDLQNARVCVEQALVHEPTHLLSLERLAYLALQQQRFSQAKSALADLETATGKPAQWVHLRMDIERAEAEAMEEPPAEAEPDADEVNPAEDPQESPESEE